MKAPGKLYSDAIEKVTVVTGEEGGHLLCGGDIHTAQLLQRLKQYQVMIKM